MGRQDIGAGRGGSPLADLESLAVAELADLIRSGGLKPAEKLKALAALEKLLDRRAARGEGGDLTGDLLSWASARGVSDLGAADTPFGAGVLQLGDCEVVPSFK